GQDTPSIGRQAELLGISRAGAYYQPVPVNPESLLVMNRIDEIYTKRPFYGVRRITEQLRRDGYLVNHKRVHHLMRNMGIQGLIPKKNLSKNSLPHPIYPYLLRGVRAGYPNHIWGTDITYIRMQHGFLYLVAYLDWYSRFILSWRLSTTLEIEFVLEAAEDALNMYGIPEIENSDQGVQFTSEQHIQLFETLGTKVSMDGRGRAMDNIFTERLWRTIKYEEVYLKSYETVTEAKQQIGEYIDFYNNERFHQSLNNKTPAEIYFGKEENLV
ncbi:MAG: IS3 family transposase, partial [Pseudonocardiaceae bacterium]